MVCVISKTGKQLMPTSNRRCRQLLKNKRAKIVHLDPVTIQLLRPSTEYTQDLSVNIDMGSKEIGYSAILHGDKAEKIVFQGEVKQRAYVNAESMTPVLKARSQYRRTRRSRKWRREARFLNRKRHESKCKVCGKNTPAGKALCKPCAKIGHHNFKDIDSKNIWLPPTIKAKADLHVRIVKVLQKYLPVSDITVETVSFDIHKILNPEITGVEYQQGEQMGFENVKMFVRFRDKYTCLLCDKQSLHLQVHHILPKRESGSDSPKNLATLCKKCHKEIDGKEKQYELLLLNKIGSKGIKLANTAQVNSFKDYIIKEIEKKCSIKPKETFGYITKFKRQKLHLEKSHSNDAIAVGIRDLNKKIVFLTTKKICKNKRRCVRQQYKAQPQKGKGFVRYRQPFNQIEGIKRGDICWHKKKKTKVIIDTLLSNRKFNAKDIHNNKRIAQIQPKYLILLQRKQSLLFS